MSSVETTPRGAVVRALSSAPLVALVAGTLSFVVAERIFLDPILRSVFDGIAALCVLVIGVAGLRARALLRGPDRAFSTAWLVGFALLAVGAGLYAGHVFLGSRPDGSPLWAIGAAGALFGGGLVVLMTELTREGMRSSEFVDAGRVRQALLVAAVLTLALGGLGFLNYAASQREWRRDYSIGGAHKPSDATVHLIQTSATPVEVLLFFEEDAAALNVVRDYFDALRDVGATVRTVDAALELKLAEELKVNQNGTVVVRAGERSEKWILGSKPEAVQRKLEKLDEEIQKRVAKLGGDPTTFYFTVGHGERSHRKAKRDERDGGDKLRRLIEATNAQVKTLGVGEGLAAKVPDDATAVIVFGPEQPFRPEEAQALLDYLDRGGGLLLLLEPGKDHGLDAVLAKLGVKLGPPLANDREFIRQSGGPADHDGIFATSFARHPAVQALYDTRGKAALLFKGAASVDEVEGEGPERKGVVRSRKDTFVDVDGDRAFTEGTDGERGIKPLAQAIELGEARALVVGDSDVLADELIRDPRDPNGAFGYLSALWLARDDAQIQSVSGPKESAMTQTAEEASAWFYVSTFGAPALILAFGVWYPRRRRRRRGGAP